jgi:hypothetical protein
MWFAALTAVGWPALTSAAVSIQSVTFAGTALNPTVTISGSGFNPAPTPLVSGYPGFTGFDYGNELVFTDSSATPNAWEAGRSTPGNSEVRDFIGIVILTYSDAQITFQFGSSYAQGYYPHNIYRLSGGDSFSMRVHGGGSPASSTFLRAPPSRQSQNQLLPS